MDMTKLNPWNWFKHEQKHAEKQASLPVKQGEMQSINPLSNMHQLHREIDRLFEDAFHGFPLGRSPLWNRWDKMFNETVEKFQANVNVASDEGQYTITLEAPGMEQKDINIELRDRALYIKGNKQQDKEEKDKHYYRIERHYGSFERVLSMPDDANAEEIAANMKNGVLTITIPRKELPQSDVKKISINS